MPLAILAIASILLTACVRRVGRNSSCEWPAENGAQALNLKELADLRHLNGDLEFAEDLAIRYVDAHFGPRSGNFESRASAGQAMNSCIVKLTDSISASHQVPKNEIKNFFGRRSFGVDVAMNLPFLVLYWLIAFMLAGKVLERYMPDENRLLALAVFAMASVACAAVGVLIGQVWSIVAENIRLGTGHLSYRIGRLPGVKHPILFWVICTVLFWSAGLAHQLKLGQRAFPR